MLVDLAFRRTYQIIRLSCGLTHLLQQRLARNTTIHHPYPSRFAIRALDLIQKRFQRRAIRRIAVQDLIGQGEPIRRHYHCDD